MGRTGVTRHGFGPSRTTWPAWTKANRWKNWPARLILGARPSKMSYA